MQVTDDDVKTRGQKEKLDEITASPPPEPDSGAATIPPKVPRDGTMVVTAKVSIWYFFLFLFTVFSFRVFVVYLVDTCMKNW